MSYVLAGPGEKRRAVASPPSAMRPHMEWQPLSGQAFLLGWGPSCTDSGMALGKGGKEPFSDFVLSPALAATMACRWNITCDSKDYTYAAKGIVTGLQQWWVTDCAIPFLAHSMCQLAPCRQCLCTPVDSMSERCLFWNKEGKKLGHRRAWGTPCFPGPVRDPLYKPG